MGVTLLALINPSEGRLIKRMGRLENFLDEHVVPDVIDHPPKAELKVTYENDVQVMQGNELTPTQVKNLPKISYDQADPAKLYTLVMVDPDAPSRLLPRLRNALHYLVTNIPGNDTSKGDVAFKFIGSGPPKGTGLHRYIYLLYEQPENKRIENGPTVDDVTFKGRPNFDMRNYAKEHNLGNPIAGNFYLAKWDPYVDEFHKRFINQ